MIKRERHEMDTIVFPGTVGLRVFCSCGLVIEPYGERGLEAHRAHREFARALAGYDAALDNFCACLRAAAVEEARAQAMERRLRARAEEKLS